MKRILIGITTADNVCYETLEALFNMVRPSDTQVDLKIVRHYSVSLGRDELARYVLSNNYDYLFFVDSDIVVPRFTLERLLAANVLVINGTYPRKETDTLVSNDPYTTLYRHDRRNLNKINFNPYFLPLSELPQEGIIPVDAAGLGCTLINCDVLRAIGHDWFIFGNEQSQLVGGTYCLGEDLYFYRECLRHDIQPYAEGSVRCKHIGKMIYQFADVCTKEK